VSGCCNICVVTVTASELSHGGISRRNRALLERLHRGMSAVFGVDDAAQLLELDHDTAGQLLRYLARRGWLSRVRRGLYVAVPLDARRSGEWIEDPWVAADRAFRPCYIGGWSACEHWDFTEQLSRTLLVITARTVHERDVIIQGLPVRLSSRPSSKLFGTIGVWRSQVRVPVSDPSRTIVDILDDPQLGGGMRSVADVLEQYLSSPHRDDALLVSYGDRLGNRTVFKRLGYLVEHGGVEAPSLVAACLERRSQGVTSLDPSVKSPGRIMRRWRLRINVNLDRSGDGW
jgi:predicted transcriptional regulator of viral defense system